MSSQIPDPFTQPQPLESARLILRPMIPWSFSGVTLHWTKDSSAMADLNLRSGNWSRYRWWKQLRKLSRKNRLCHGIWTKDGNRLIGLHMALMQKPALDVVTGILIGEREFRGKGFGTEAKMAVVDHMFRDCGAHRITCWVNARNFPSLHMNVLCGFKQEAQMRDQVRLPDGSWTDYIGFGLLRSEWQAKTSAQSSSKESEQGQPA